LVREGIEQLNATRTSVAGDGWTEPTLCFRLWRKRNDSRTGRFTKDQLP